MTMSSIYLIAELSLLIRRYATKGSALKFLQRKHGLSLEDGEQELLRAGVEFPDKLWGDRSVLK